MIRTKRMKLDLIAQATLIIGIAAFALSGFHWAWWITTLILLGLWQIGSALQLAVVYEYQQRYPFLWALTVLSLLLPPGLWLLGPLMLAPLSLAVLAYFWVTLRDTLTLLQRPRSFWDL